MFKKVKHRVKSYKHRTNIAIITKQCKIDMISTENINVLLSNQGSSSLSATQKQCFTFGLRSNIHTEGSGGGGGTGH